MRLTWPFTGRSNELRLIEAAIFDPGSSGVVVRGDAGVGKSRIARESLKSAAATGYEVRWIAGTSSARELPLGALASWVEPFVNDNLELVRAAIASLTSASPGKTVVLGVDDVPLLDDLSTFVLHQIIARRAAKMVLTVRYGEPIPPGTQELWKGGQFGRLDLEPLSKAEVAALVSAALDGPLELQAAERLWTLTRGNPLYLRNIVEQEIADERITSQHGHWRWLGDPVVPPGLVELIEERIGALPTSVSDVIDTLAVGEPVELGSLTRITDPASVEQADKRGLISFDQVGGRVDVRLAHPLYGEVRRSRAAATRLRRLRGLVAVELAASADPDDMRALVRRGALSVDSDLEADADLLTTAARGAVWLWDLSLADRLAAAAIHAGKGVEASLIRAYALSCVGRGHEADAVLADVQVDEVTDVDHARLAFLRGINRLFTLADPVGAKSIVDDVSRATAPQAHSCINAFLAVYWAAMGRPELVRKFSESYAWDQLPDLVARRMTAWALTLALGEAGRTADAVATAEAGYLVPIRSFVIIADAHATALLLSGQLAKAEHPTEILRQRAAVNPVQQFALLGTALSGRAALGTGQLHTACSRIGPIVEALADSGETNGWGYRCQIPLTMALAMRGLIDEASAALNTLEGVRHPSWRYLDYEYAIAHAWVDAAHGAVTEAIATVLSAAETACANGQFAAEVMCLQTATQFGDRGSGPRLRELEAIVEGPRAGIAARFAEALHASDGAELLAVSEELEAMGDLIAAVDAAAHAAITYRRRDRRGSALGCSTRAEALAERCGARTPAFRQAAERLPLTDREREIVMLLGDGLSNRDIATRLTLSVRTVESHIYKAMAKTGTTSRDDLAALLPRPKPRSRT